jgi:hypothetical protein
MHCCPFLYSTLLLVIVKVIKLNENAICIMRPTKGVTQVAYHSFCSCFVACFIVINVAVTFDP